MTKVLVIAKEYPEFYNKEMYVLWTRVDDKGIWYYLSFDPNAIIRDVYLGKSQVKLL